MKKAIVALTLLVLSSNVAYSEESNTEVMAAPLDYVLNLLRVCKEDAEADAVIEAEMNTYLLTCINDELVAADYKEITVLPEAK